MSNRLRFVALFATVMSLVAMPSPSASASTITVGASTASFNPTSLDTCTSCSYILNSAFGAAGTISTYTLLAYTNGFTGDLTPILLSGSNSSGATTFTITGIGTKRTDTNFVGTQTFDFGLTSGSAAVTANTYFGWFDTNGPMVTYSYGSTTGTFLFDGADTLGRSIALQNTVQYQDTQNTLDNRTYSINATAVTVTPEPTSLLLLGTGVTCIALLMRRRSRA